MIPSDALWQADAERVGGRALVDKINALVGQMMSISNDINATSGSAERSASALVVMLAKLAEMDTMVRNVIAEYGPQNRERDDRIGVLEGAFPKDYFDGHRRYHEAEIEWRELRNKVVRECLVKMAQASILASFGWLGYAVWQSFLISVKR